MTIKAITFRVAGPIGCEWKNLRETLDLCWQDSTRLANWAVTEMAKADVVRTPEMQKLPPTPANKKGSPFYLYPFARQVCPTMDAQSVVAVLNTVQGNYKKRRRDVIWRGAISLPRYRFPFPYSIPAVSYKCEWLSDTEKAPVVKVRLRGVWFTLRLRAGPGFIRQIKEFAQIIDGTAKQCQLDIFREVANHSDNRIGARGHSAPGGGESVHYNYVVKIVAKFPVVERKFENTLEVTTAPDSFLVLQQFNKEIWRENADHVRKWIIEHQNRIHRLSEDLKFETRQGKRYQQILDAMTRAKNKFHDRMLSFRHEAAAHVIGKAIRGRCKKILYKDAERSYFPSFQWFEFRETLRNKTQAAGIEFCESEDSDKSQATLSQEQV